MKIFYNDKEVEAWQKEGDVWKPGQYRPYRVVHCSYHSTYPIAIDEYDGMVIDNPNGRDTEYFNAISIPQLLEDDSCRELIIQLLKQKGGQ